MGTPIRRAVGPEFRQKLRLQGPTKLRIPVVKKIIQKIIKNEIQLLFTFMLMLLYLFRVKSKNCITSVPPRWFLY